MNIDFDGTLVLERMTEIGKLEEFAIAVDNDDFELARKLMRLAEIEDTTIQAVLVEMGKED